MRGWWLRAALTVAVVAALLTLVPIEDVWRAIRSVNPWVWAAAVGVFVAGHTLNALKFRLLVGPSVASVGACVRAHFAGIAANLGLPGVAGGDVVRATYLAPTAGGARVAIAAVADRIVDGTVLLLIAIVAGRLAGPPPVVAESPATGRRWLIIMIIVAVVAVLIAVGRRKLKRSRSRTALRDALSAIVRRKHAVALAMTMSLGVQSTLVLTNVWLASEVGVSIALAPWFLAWTATKLSVLLPISVGGIGVREATLVSVLAAYGAPADRVLAAGILWEGAIIAGSSGGFLLTQLTRTREPGRRVPR